MTKKISHLLKPKTMYTVAGTLWIAKDGDRCFGIGRMELLQKIAKTGSINKAAKEMGMSYKKALNMIHDLNIQWNQPMIITQTGGEGGGGAVLTAAAIAVMDYHEAMRLRFLKFLDSENQLLQNI